MCGIAGFQGSFDQSLLERMNHVLAHRGPDGDGTVLLESGLQGRTVGLAHRRLAIIDLSPNGDQPMGVRCASCSAFAITELALVYNGEVYNHRELRSTLERDGHTFFSATDSEVLLHAYAQYGLEVLSALNGIFAFAIYDGRERGRPSGVQQGDLLIARDPLGVKPLYHAKTSQGFLFASELKALLQHGAVSRDIDVAALHYQLAYLWAPAPHTCLQGVRKLPPGRAIIVRGGAIVREWSYYDLPYGREYFTATESQLAEELHARLETAVRRQLIADVPVGAFLSGGLDSSTVVAMMRQAQPRSSPRCYCIGFKGDAQLDGAPSDVPFARTVSRHLGADLTTLEVEPDVIRDLPRVIYHLDEPQADPAPINALLIAEQARDDGIPVLLSGTGGDDLFSGYRRHQAVYMERYWKWLPQLLRSAAAQPARRAAAGDMSVSMRTPFARRLAKLFANADTDSDVRTVSYFWWSGDAMRRALYSGDLARATADLDTAAPLLESLERIPSERSPLNRMLYLEGRHFLADHNLNYTDKMGMAAGVEIRVPLLDLELVDFATRIPPGMKQKGMMSKSILKRAMARDLPRAVVNRAKTGFGAPLRRWLRIELRELVRDTLSPDSLRDRGLFDATAVQRLMRLNDAGHIDGSYTLFALMCIETWCRIFLDSPASSPAAVPSSVR